MVYDSKPEKTLELRPILRHNAVIKRTRGKWICLFCYKMQQGKLFLFHYQLTWSKYILTNNKDFSWNKQKFLYSLFTPKHFYLRLTISEKAPFGFTTSTKLSSLLPNLIRNHFLMFLYQNPTIFLVLNDTISRILSLNKKLIEIALSTFFINENPFSEMLNWETNWSYLCNYLQVRLNITKITSFLILFLQYVQLDQITDFQ